MLRKAYPVHIAQLQRAFVWPWASLGKEGNPTLNKLSCRSTHGERGGAESPSPLAGPVKRTVSVSSCSLPRSKPLQTGQFKGGGELACTSKASSFSYQHRLQTWGWWKSCCISVDGAEVMLPVLRGGTGDV